MNGRDADTATPLHWAVYNGHLEIAKLLVASGASLTARTKDGQTPLHWAAISGKMLCLHYLVKCGSDLRAADTCGYNIVHLGAQNNKPFVVFYGINSGIPIDTTGTGHFPCLSSSSSSPSLLMPVFHHPPLQHFTDNDGHTALHWAAYKGEAMLALYLVKHGATVDQPDRQGRTPLHWAALRGHLSCVRWLTEYGADFRLYTDKGESASVLARRNGNDHVTEYLLACTEQAPDRATLRVRARAAGYAVLLAVPLLCAVLAHLPGLLVVPFLAAAVHIGRQHIDPALGQVRTYAFVNWTVSLIATSAWHYFVHVVPATPGHALYHVLHVAYQFAFFYVFYRTVRADPGALARDTFTLATLVDSLERGVEIPADMVCWSCGVLRPLRAHHCAVCDECVPRFDHHCVWINRCVGAHNHRQFLLFLALTFGSLAFCTRHSWLALSLSANAAPLFPLLPFLATSFAQRPFATTLLVLHAVHTAWLLLLLAAQLRPIARGLTSHEAERGTKYRYLHDRYGRFHNPFDRGTRTNFREFFCPSHSWDTPDIAQFVELNMAPVEPLPPPSQAACASGNCSSCPQKNHACHGHGSASVLSVV